MKGNEMITKLNNYNTVIRGLRDSLEVLSKTIKEEVTKINDEITAEGQENYSGELYNSFRANIGERIERLSDLSKRAEVLSVKLEEVIKAQEKIANLLEKASQ